MKVSVLTTTYNHEKVVGQAIDSVLAQDVSFDYEIVIGEDASTDQTRQIVLDYQEKHRDKIRVLLRDASEAERDRALGIGGKTGFISGLEACQGQYIALLDGDDYWTSPHKLQKQVDFLDSHPDFAICFHNSEIIAEGNWEGAKTFSPPHQKEISTIEDLLAGNFIHSGSSVFRRGLFAELPRCFLTSETGDWSLHVINAQFGKIGYMDEIMAAYRVHANAMWSSAGAVRQLVSAIRLLDEFNEYLGFKYSRRIKETQYEYSRDLAAIYREQGDLVKARASLRRCLRLRLSASRKPERDLLTELMELHVPFLYYPLNRLSKYLYSANK